MRNQKQITLVLFNYCFTDPFLFELERGDSFGLSNYLTLLKLHK